MRALGAVTEGGCRWDYLEDRIDRSAWIAAVIATVSFVVMIFVSMWLKRRLDDSYEAERQKQEDQEKGVHKGPHRELPLFCCPCFCLDSVAAASTRHI